ncbi:hypothetical protein J6590_066488 [Homalodisca vitripennis]|nr:hypothetical protein J6590_066488 [Homalodisca vitripennis]
MYSFLQDLPREQRSRLDSGNADLLKPILKYHIADGRLTSSQFRADLLVPTQYSGRNLRINKYSSRIETVNCVLLHRKDQEANNGVVHIIGGLLDPSFAMQRDLAELIVQDGRFQQLSQAMDKEGLMAKLRATNEPLTVLAPSDDAFTKIRPSRLSRILNDKQALKELLENHVLPHVMCIPAIIGEHKVRSYGTNRVAFDCDRKSVKIENNRIHADFTMGSNGVIYLINDVLVPNRAKSLIQLLEEEKMSSFLQLVQYAGLEDAFENFGDYTVFVPSEAAMFSLPTEVLKSLRSNREKARKFVLFHATQGRLKIDKMNNNQVIMSLNEENPLRIQLYRTGVITNVGPRIMAAVEGASLRKVDLEGINGVIHIINKALFPVNNTAGELLQLNGTYKIFLRAMEKVTSENPQLIDFTRPKTFFVPTDEAFKNIGEAQRQRLLSDPTYMAKTVRNHICESMMITESIQTELQYEIPSLLNSLTVLREDENLKVVDSHLTLGQIPVHPTNYRFLYSSDTNRV